ncbi:transcription factor HES-4-A isoform X2 [Eurosta solidaginis]|uniref:transcription factor HES-4-A isoform X2 n=1 Tax=Eurosta solidaginis TaxID=178769 RepID=UPI003530A2C9
MPEEKDERNTEKDGENLSKLEKADILELTVRHLHRLRETNGLFVGHTNTINMEKFWAGFQHCAVEVSQFLQNYDHQNKHVNVDLIKYITNCVPNMAATNATTPATNGAHSTTHIQQTPLAMHTSANAANVMAYNINEHYQRFPTPLSDLRHVDGGVTKKAPTTIPPPPIINVAAALNISQQQMKISTSAVSNFERIWEAATRAAATGAGRMRPYGRKDGLSKHCNGACDGVLEVSGDDSSCSSSSGNDSEYPSADGIVWRPW